MNSPEFDIIMLIVNIVIAVSTTATAALVIIKMVTDRRAKLDKYERAIREGYVYSREVKTFQDMCDQFIQVSIVRHNDGKSWKYGFHKVIRNYNIDNPKDFLKFVIKNQTKKHNKADRWTFKEEQHLLKLK